MIHPIAHLRTICRHRHWVFYYCCRAGIPLQGLLHDLSKFSPTELLPGIRYYQGNRSPNEQERELTGYSSAWMHHKGRNKHHFEYWSDVNPETRCYEPVQMPQRYLIEMFCDRVAASRVYRGKAYTNADPLNYFLKGDKQHRRPIHPTTSKQLHYLLRLLAEKGEAATFAYIRTLKR